MADQIGRGRTRSLARCRPRPAVRMAAHAPRHPFGRGRIQRDPPAGGHLVEDGFVWLALQGFQRGAGELGVKVVAGDETVLWIEKGKGIGRQFDGFFQPRELVARIGDVIPQQDGIAILVAARLDLDDASALQHDVLRRPGALTQLAQPRGDEGIGAAGQRAGGDFRQFQPDQLFIAFADQGVMRRQAAEDIVEMGVGIDQALASGSKMVMVARRQSSVCNSRAASVPGDSRRYSVRRARKTPARMSDRLDSAPLPVAEVFMAGLCGLRQTGLPSPESRHSGY